MITEELIKMTQRNYEIWAELRDDLSNEEEKFILNKIGELKTRYAIIQEDTLFYRKVERRFDDIVPCVSFFVLLNQYNTYFKVLEYSSLVEGIVHQTLKGEKEEK